MLPKPEVIKIAEQVNNKTGQASSSSSNESMKFTLQPGGGEEQRHLHATRIILLQSTRHQQILLLSKPMEKLTDGGT